MAEGEWAAAMEELLEIIMRDKTWNAEAPRKTYVAILELLTPPQPKPDPLLLARRLRALNWWARPPWSRTKPRLHAQRLPPQAEHGAELRPCGLVARSLKKGGDRLAFFVAGFQRAGAMKSEAACACW